MKHNVLCQAFTNLNAQFPAEGTLLLSGVAHKHPGACSLLYPHRCNQNNTKKKKEQSAAAAMS